MQNPTNPLAVRAKRDGPRGWHWVYPFDPAIHERYEEPADAFSAFDHDGDGKPGGKLSKAEIIEDLDRLGIDYDPAWPWSKLNAALRKDKAAREAAINLQAEADVR